jgi:hypothetical protein
MSFSAEIKDFVNGFQGGMTIGGGIQDRKMEREKWEFEKAFKQDASARAERALDMREKGMGLRSKAQAERAAARRAAQEEKDRARRANQLLPDEPKTSKTKEPVYDDEYDFEDGFGDTDTYDDEYESSALPATEVDDEEIAFAAEGGLIEDEEDREDEKTDLEPVAAAIPTEAPQAGATEEPEVNRAGKSDPLFREAANITRDVMDEWNGELSEKPEAISANPKKSQSRISEVMPASPDAIKAIDAKIDPNNEMEPYRKGAVRLVEAYNFFVEKGDVVKARKIAGEIIKFNQMASMTLGQLAVTAIDRGDLQSASKLVTDAYDQVPDGGKIEAQPTSRGTIAYKIDKAGTAKEQGEIGARELWALANKVADGSAFLERMTALAAEGTPTSGSNQSPEGKGKKKRGSYSSDVMAAAKARKIYDALNDRFESAVNDFGADSEEAAALKQQVSAAVGSYNAAWEKAQSAADKTKRPMSVLEKDFKAKFNSIVIDPAEIEPAVPETPVDNRGWWDSTMPTWMGGDEAPTAPAAAPAPAATGAPDSALPTQPAPGAPAPAPAATGGRPIPPETMLKAKEAIAAGASREAVIQRLRENGFNTGGL